MSHNHVLSSEQALKDYFSALLDEPPEELEPAQETEVQVEPEVSQPVEVVPQLHKEVESPPLAINQVIEAPSLSDIQRLLDRLETSDPVGNLSGVEALIVQNTLNLSVVDKIEVEEIQEWDVEELESQPVVETIAEELDIKVKLESEVEVEIDDVTHQQEQQAAADVNESLVLRNQQKVWQSTKRDSAFQVLFFDVYGVTFAVPLDELGGIHRLEETNHLIGRPAWYFGLQTTKTSQLDVVDTAKWVMADKLKDDSYKTSYQYIVMLGESLWGLACGELKGTELIRSDAVNWRATAGKRPWLAGMVKEKMCALIHVEALIQMLYAGQDVKALDK
jgi:purine-binding chemotaxis protein CheW